MLGASQQNQSELFHQQSRLLQESSRSRGGLDEMLIGERAAFAQGSVQNFKE